jgi:hypothetical protein
MFGSLVIADNNWVTALVPIVIAIIYLLNHVLSALKPAAAARNKQPRRAAEPAERPLRPPQKQTVQPSGNQAQLNAEIEQFLKRANERRGDRTRREPPLKGPPPKAPPKVSARPPMREQPAAVEPDERRDFDSVAASVEKHLDKRGFSQRAEHLADDIVHADEEMEQHLKKAFGRRVGTLGDTTAKAPATPLTDNAPVAAGPVSPTAATLANLLANPQNIKQAVIFKEILERPDYRW